MTGKYEVVIVPCLPSCTFCVLFQCLSGVFPQYFVGTETFECLIQFLKEEEAVGKIIMCSNLETFRLS